MLQAPRNSVPKGESRVMVPPESDKLCSHSNYHSLASLSMPQILQPPIISAKVNMDKCFIKLLAGNNLINSSYYSVVPNSAWEIERLLLKR